MSGRVFVLGAPRSGTTVMGRFIGSHPLCADLGEYYGFFLSLSQVPQMMERVPATHKADFIESLISTSITFADGVRDRSNSIFWCDQTPWNIRVASELADRMPDALFVLMLRHYRGCVQSLRRSFADGYRWAGSQIADSAALWAECYENVATLPRERVLAISYERFCYDPKSEIGVVERFIAERCGVARNGFDTRVLAASHAGGSGNTVARLVEGEAEFQRVPSFDAQRWTDGMEAICRTRVGDVDADLQRLFPESYLPPT